MNQILYTGGNKKKGPLEIKTVIIIFAVIITLFAIALIGKGIYGIASSNNSKKGLSEPVITVEEIDGKVQISIIHDRAIDKINYSWNNGTTITMQGKGQTSIKEEIDLPTGENTLKLIIIDNTKAEYTYTKDFKVSEKDTIAPEIEFAVEGSKVKIVARDDRELRQMSYNWDEEDKTTVEPREDSLKQIEEKISILKGEHTLKITAVDAAGNETTKEQVFKGAKKPTIEIEEQNDEIVVTVKDEENIQKIEITVNGQLSSTDSEDTGTPLNMKEAKFIQKLQSGENNIVITAYNVSGLSEQVTKQITR